MLLKMFIFCYMVNILSLFENALTRESVQSGAGWEVMERERMNWNEMETDKSW